VGCNYFKSAYLWAMRAKRQSLIYAICAIVLVSCSWAYASAKIADDGGSSAAKPLGQVVVAQAWWDAAYNAAIGQRHTTNERAAPLVRSESRRYRRPLR
jgi:hypothetical protein